MGQPVQRGSNGRSLSGLIRAASRVGLEWQLLWLVGFVDLVRLLRMQRNDAGLAPGVPAVLPASFFIGFGAGSEEQMFSRYCAGHGGLVARLDQTNPASFAQWGRVGLEQGLHSLAVACTAARRAIAALPAELVPWRNDFLVHIGIGIAHFAYMRAWCALIRNDKALQLQELAFAAADTNAFAAAAMKLPIAYLQHGLIFHLVLPDFARIEALTKDEADYFKRALPQAAISFNRQYPVLPVSQLKGPVLLASIYFEEAYLQLVLPLLQWARDNGIPVVVRPHPREKPGFWSTLKDQYGLIIESPVDGFSETIARLRPRLVVSWFSTVLADSLQQGVIPVSVCADDDPAVAAMVYPLFQRCLRWSHDAGLIGQLMKDDELYSTVLAGLSASPGEQCQ